MRNSPGIMATRMIIHTGMGTAIITMATITTITPTTTISTLARALQAPRFRACHRNA